MPVHVAQVRVCDCTCLLWYVKVDIPVKVVLQGALRIEGATVEKARANKLPLWVPYQAWLGTYRGVVPALVEVRGLPGEAAASEGSKAYQGFGNLTCPSGVGISYHFKNMLLCRTTFT